MADGAERRRYFRLPVQIPATFQVVHAPGAELAGWTINQEHEAVIKDISGGGARLDTQSSLPIGTRILIKIPFLDDNVVAEVVHKLWTLTCGVRFVALSDENQRKIIEFIFKEQQRRKRMERNQTTK